MARQRRLERYRSIHSSDWDRAEEAVPPHAEARAAAKRAEGLADPNRLALAIVIRAAKQACDTDLAELTGIERSVVSRHLKRLRDAGLSRMSRDGKLAIHSLTKEGEELLSAVLGER